MLSVKSKSGPLGFLLTESYLCVTSFRSLRFDFLSASKPELCEFGTKVRGLIGCALTTGRYGETAGSSLWMPEALMRMPSELWLLATEYISIC